MGLRSGEVVSTGNTIRAATDPVKGGSWNQLPADKQAAFSVLAAKDWASMDSLTFVNTFEANVKTSNEYALYLYENNVDTTVKRLVSADPKHAYAFTDAKEITKDTNGSYKVLHNELLKATAFDIGKTDKSAGIVLLALAVDPRREPSDVVHSEYSNFDFNTSAYSPSYDAVMVEPTIENQGTDTAPYYLETYSDVIPFKIDGIHQDRKYFGLNVVNALTGATTYQVSLAYNQPN